MPTATQGAAFSGALLMFFNLFLAFTPLSTLFPIVFHWSFLQLCVNILTWYVSIVAQSRKSPTRACKSRPTTYGAVATAHTAEQFLLPTKQPT